MNRRVKPLIACVLLLSPVLSWGQITLNALVADSASLKPISFVAVRIAHSYKGTTTNEQGYFVMDVSEKDTLSFSIVGYYPKKIPAKELQKTSVVYLTQEVQMLKTVEFRVININGLLPKLDAPSAYQNSAYAPQNDRPVVTGFQGFQTFGPGYIARGGDLQPSREERKLEKIKKENVAAKGYVALVNDPEVKDKVMKDYSLTETQYYDHLAKFNEKNKEFIYHLEDDEVVRLIFLYFMDNAKK